jgi:hypothetical protein
MRPFLNSQQTSDSGNLQTDAPRQDETFPFIDRSQDAEGCSAVNSALGVAPRSAGDSSTSDVSDVVIPSPTSSLAAPSEGSMNPSLSVIKPHRDSHRHHHGVTNQETGRVLKRLSDETDEPSLASLAELEVDSVLDHKKKGSKYRYFTKWVDDKIPNTWLDRASFNQKEVLEEYWAGKAKGPAPREFKKKQRGGSRQQPYRKTKTKGKQRDASE